jgi:crotonobetainyl-CoA:carnitine CoA-transferase CaiB-like acyl-CoA transferase
MLVGMERTDGGEQPVLVPGNPVKIVGTPDGGDRRVPWLGEHTDEILRTELGLDVGQVAALRASSVVG